MAYGNVATGPSKGPTPLPTEGYGSLEWFKTQILAAEDKVKKLAPDWKRNINSQINKPLGLMPKADTIIVPLDHANVEQKKAQLYFKNPEVQLTAAPGYSTNLSDAVQAFGALVNEYLGPDGVNTEAMAEEVLSDVLCPSGIGFTVLGIDITQDGTKPMQVGERPVAAPGAVLNLQPVMEPIIEQVPNIIHQSYFWTRISPLYGLVPDRFSASDFEKAPWLGYKFEMDPAVAMKTLGLTEDEAKAATGECDRLNEDDKPTSYSDVVFGYCLSYQAHLFNPKVKNPEERWRLVIVEGVDRIIKNDQPYQRYAPDGKTLIGLRGHFIHVYTPRYVSDTAIPPSDVSMSRHLVDELGKFRSQMMQQRDRARPMRWINITMLDSDIREKVRRGEYQDIILSNANMNEHMGEVAHAQYPRENFESARVTMSDISLSWAMGQTQRGQAEETRRTATELSIQQGNSDARLEKERNRFAKWYSKGAEKLGGLIQLFEDERETVLIVGAEGAEKLVAWDRSALPLRFVCTAKPDTMIRQDSRAEYKKWLDIYQMTANDPHAKRVEILKMLFRIAGADPSKLLEAQLPDKGPEPPKVSITVKGEDLNPAMPQFPVVQQMLATGGIQIDPANIALGLQLATKAQMAGGPSDPASGGPVSGQPSAQTEHGGTAEQVSPLSKHSSDLSGRLPGGGSPYAPSVQ